MNITPGSEDNYNTNKIKPDQKNYFRTSYSIKQEQIITVVNKTYKSFIATSGVNKTASAAK